MVNSQNNYKHKKNTKEHQMSLNKYFYSLTTCIIIFSFSCQVFAQDTASKPEEEATLQPIKLSAPDYTRGKSLMEALKRS